LEDLLVHEEIDSILVPSSHSGDGSICYRIFFGTINWEKKIDTKHKAIVIFMQDGNEENWDQAKIKKQIRFRQHPHILVEDFEKVKVAINQIAEKNNENFNKK